MSRAERRRLDRQSSVPSSVPILGHDLNIRLDSFCMSILNVLTQAQGDPRVGRTQVATILLSNALRQGAMNIYVADQMAAVMVRWFRGRAALIGPVEMVPGELVEQ